jgi:SAM-dependent methyltransferase
MSKGDASARFFDAIARRYDRVYAPGSRASRARMDRVLRELPERARVLDLGVGTGRELPSLLDAGHTVVGLDVSREMLVLCARRSRPIQLAHADFWEQLGFADASFDAVLALHGTLAHPPTAASLPDLVREIARVLLPGGVFVAEVPAPGWLDDATRDAASGQERMVRRLGPNRCVYEDTVARASIEATFHTEAEWRALLGAGFGVMIEPIVDGGAGDEMLVVARLPR